MMKVGKVVQLGEEAYVWLCRTVHRNFHRHHRRRSLQQRSSQGHSSSHQK